MKVKVSELEDAELNYWVAKAAGLATISYSEWKKVDDGSLHFIKWIIAGPIIEREKINQLWCEHYKEWHSFKGSEIQNNISSQHSSKDKLTSGLRCYVASKFGDEVDDPQTQHED